MSIGHEESEEILDTEEEGRVDFGTNQHGGMKNFLLLLGDGHDVMSADGVLEYRISNVHQYLFGVQNPEEVLESVVYQVLMEQTSSRTLEEALSENLIVLAQVVTTEIQNRIGQYGWNRATTVYLYGIAPTCFRCQRVSRCGLCSRLISKPKCCEPNSINSPSFQKHVPSLFRL